MHSRFTLVYAQALFPARLFYDDRQEKFRLNYRRCRTTSKLIAATALVPLSALRTGRA